MTTENTALVPKDEVSIEPSNLLEVIAKAVANPKVDVEKMKSLLAMHKEIVADQRKVAFGAALQRLQAKCPQIEKDGRIIVKGVERSRYSKLETIDEAVRPLLSEEGFAFSFNTDSKDAKLFTITCTLTHREGHSETKSLMLPIDAMQYRSDLQSISSTVSTARRQLIKLWLNIIEKGEDLDGAQLEPITEEQARELNTLMKDVKADTKRFLEYMQVDSLESILRRDYTKAVTALESKRRK